MHASSLLPPCPTPPLQHNARLCPPAIPLAVSIIQCCSFRKAQIADSCPLCGILVPGHFGPGSPSASNMQVGDKMHDLVATCTAVLAAAALALRGCKALRSSFAGICEAPECTTRGGACTPSLSGECCEDINFYSECDPVEKVCKGTTCQAPAEVDCPCETSDDCAGDLECATDGLRANSCQVWCRSAHNLFFNSI